MLIVDDDESIRAVLTEALIDSGYEVATAMSTVAALREVDRRTPDAIILDMRMPDDGPRFKTELDRRSLHAPIVAVSANIEGPQWASQLDLTFVAKPFNLEDVVAALRTALA